MLRALLASVVLFILVISMTGSWWIAGLVAGLLMVVLMTLPKSSKPNPNPNNTASENGPVTGDAQPAEHTIQPHAHTDNKLSAELRANPPPQPVHPDDEFMYSGADAPQPDPEPFKRGHNDERGLETTFTVM